MDDQTISVFAVLAIVIVLFLVVVYAKNKPSPPPASDTLTPLWNALTAALASGAEVNAVLRCCENLFSAARQWAPLETDRMIERAYREVLQHTTKRPELRPTALWLGRQAYASRRPKGVLTIYDEQAIQNDLMAHSGAPAPPPAVPAQ